jgi:hypothetical protein
MTKTTMTQRQQFWLTHIEGAMRNGEQLQRYACMTVAVAVGASIDSSSRFTSHQRR